MDILTPNEGELLALAPGARDLDRAAQHVLARGPRMRGGHPGTSTERRRSPREGTLHLPAFAVKSVDTVGAGDCFSACLGVALAEGQPFRTPLRFAIAAAGLSTTLPGAQASMPTRGRHRSFASSS